MVEFNAWCCRNCKHWHYTPTQHRPTSPHQCDVPVNGQECGCNNFESNDNLKYLEEAYERTKAL